jgi:hypothetical protein
VTQKKDINRGKYASSSYSTIYSLLYWQDIFELSFWHPQSGFNSQNIALQGGKKNSILINFLAKSGNSKHFSGFFLFFKKINNCGHYFCLPSTKKMVTMFACHLHSSDQSCVCRVTFKHLPQPLRSHIHSFGTIFSKLKKT